MSGPGTPSETPGHHALTPNQVGKIQGLRDVGSELEGAIKALQVDEDCDQRWVSIARTHFQEGLMAAVRAVTKPTFF
ncbi:MAG TPA: hypothetical protein VMQ17_13635 [Candidatus Sulfotelmatobacter sp.]|nr:hypothetical protein [Candidatus Sulfotelmatobacter sp.]